MSDDRPLVVFEVDLLEIRPVTWRVVAHDEFEAREKARNGKGQDVSGVDYVEGDIVDVRYAQ